MNTLKYFFRIKYLLKKTGSNKYSQKHGCAASLVEHDEEDTEVQVKYKPLEKLPVKLPLIKNIFQAKLDTDFFAFPEFLGHERLKLLDKNTEVVRKLVNENINSEEIDKQGYISDDVLDKLGQLKLFGLSAPRSLGGAEFTHTERARIFEIVSKDTSVAALLFNQETLGHKLIYKYGDDYIKDKYLKPLVSGKLFSAFCFGEADHGSDAAAFETNVIRNGADWFLSGSKVWVMNAEKADLFIVFAKVRLINSKPNIYYDVNGEEILFPEDIGIFLIEKNPETVIIGPKINTTGLRGLSMCEVTFKDAFVPEKNVLIDFATGYDVVKDLLTEDRYIVGCLALGILKNVENDIITYSIERKLHNHSLYKFGQVQDRISKLSVTQYVIESLIYFTTGIMDMYDGQDCEVENAIVKVFSTEAALEALNDSSLILGGRAFLAGTPYDRNIRDLRFLSLFDHNNDLYRCLITLNSLQYISNDVNKMIVENRNPFYYPYNYFKNILKRRFTKATDDDPELYLKLKYYLHPSLEYLANYLEYCILRFHCGVTCSLSRLGPNTVDDQMHIKRMADCAILIYAMIAVLSRASRSYCIGSKYAQEEIIFAETFVRDSHKKFQIIVEGLIAGQYFVTDVSRQKLAERIVECNGYFLTEPLKLNY
ncbi:hypothetical protein PGB90_003198 [Kerria lacca]